jgi:hypothetical protein
MGLPEGDESLFASMVHNSDPIEIDNHRVRGWVTLGDCP